MGTIFLVYIYVCMSVCRFVNDSMGNPYKKSACQNAWADIRSTNMHMLKVSFRSLKQGAASSFSVEENKNVHFEMRNLKQTELQRYLKNRVTKG